MATSSTRKVMKCPHCATYLRLVAFRGRVVWKHAGVIKAHCDRIRAKKATKETTHGHV